MLQVNIRYSSLETVTQSKSNTPLIRVKVLQSDRLRQQDSCSIRPHLVFTAWMICFNCDVKRKSVASYEATDFSFIYLNIILFLKFFILKINTCLINHKLPLLYLHIFQNALHMFYHFPLLINLRNLYFYVFYQNQA